MRRLETCKDEKNKHHLKEDEKTETREEYIMTREGT